jgi:uncharacterized protein (UPF0264 family)
MTGMLASVRTVEEARLALAAGVDILDLKEPAAGTLGALPIGIIEAVVGLAGGDRPVSATVGDLTDPECIAAAVAATAAAGVDIVKVGVFDHARQGEILERLAPFARRGIRIVAVLFADRGADLDVEACARHGLHGVMIDTAGKEGGGLRHLLADTTLRRFVDAARDCGLLSGLAGSLRVEDIAPLRAVGPDYLGFRGALCADARREAAIDAARLRQVRSLLPVRTVRTSNDWARAVHSA